MATDTPQTPDSHAPDSHAPVDPKPGATYHDPNRPGDAYKYDPSDDDPWHWEHIRKGHSYNWLADDELPEGLVPVDGEGTPADQPDRITVSDVDWTVHLPKAIENAPDGATIVVAVDAMRELGQRAANRMRRTDLTFEVDGEAAP